MNYDVIVVGAGIGGLTAALLLAQSGKKVGVFEKHYIPGGYVTNFTRKGKNGQKYTFDSSLHALSSLGKKGIVHSIFKKLGVLDKVTFLKDNYDTSLTVKDEVLKFEFEFESFKKFLTERYPEERNAIDKIFSYIERLFDSHYEYLSDNPTNLSDMIKELQAISIEEFLNKYTSNKELIEIFCYLWGYFGLPPSQLNAFYYLSGMGSYLLAETHYVKNGSGYLSEVIAKEIENLGSKIHLLSEITNIETKDNKVISIKTKKGDIFTCEEFVFACDPNHLFTLIPPTKEVEDYINNMKSLEKSMSITQLYLGLDCSTEEIGLHNAHIFSCIDLHDEYFKNMQQGIYKNLSYCMTCYDKLDPELNKGGAFLNIAIADFESNWPKHGTPEYKNQKEKMTKLLLDEVCKIAPTVKDHIQVIELSTPRTMERYTNNTSGSIYGWAQNTKQGGFNRYSFKTPFDNAILVGAWSFPGGGYSGAIYSGYLGARKLLSKMASSKVSSDLLPIDQLMKGLVERFNPENANGLDITYKFLFEGYEPIHLEVKNNNARLLSNLETPEKVDTTLTMTHEVWHKIAFNEISGQDALLDGLVTCEGSLKNFALIPKVFNKI